MKLIIGSISFLQEEDDITELLVRFNPFERVILDRYNNLFDINSVILDKISIQHIILYI